MKILIITSHSYTSGVESHTYDLIAELIKRGFKVDALAPVEGPWVNKVRLLGVTVHIFNFYKHYFLRLFGLFKIISNGHYDIVHNHAFTRIGLIAAKLARVKRTVCTVHVGGLGKDLLSGMSRFRLSDRIVDFYVDIYIANSNSTKQELLNRHIRLKKICVIYLGLSEKFFKISYIPDFQKEELIFGSLGRLETQKGFDILIDACTLLNFPYRCLIGGTGSMGKSLQEKIVCLNLEEKVTLLGEQKPIDFYQKIDLFILSSRFESFGLVLIEAAACGLPIISADLAAALELSKIITAIRFFKQGDPIDLSKTIAHLYQKRGDLHNIVINQRSQIRTCTIEQMVNSIIRVYQADA